MSLASTLGLVRRHRYRPVHRYPRRADWNQDSVMVPVLYTRRYLAARSHGDVARHRYYPPKESPMPSEIQPNTDVDDLIRPAMHFLLPGGETPTGLVGLCGEYPAGNVTSAERLVTCANCVVRLSAVHLVVPTWSAYLVACGLPTNMTQTLASSATIEAVTCPWCKAAYATKQGLGQPPMPGRRIKLLDDGDDPTPVSPSPLRGHETVGTELHMADGSVVVSPTEDGGVQIVWWRSIDPADELSPPSVVRVDQPGALQLALAVLTYSGTPAVLGVPQPAPEPAAEPRMWCPIRIRSAEWGDLPCEQTWHPLEEGQACAGQLSDGTPWEYRWAAAPGTGAWPERKEEGITINDNRMLAVHDMSGDVG